MTGFNVWTVTIPYSWPLTNRSTDKININYVIGAANASAAAGATEADRRRRVVDSQTGEVLWTGDLPAGGDATPMTYKLRPGGKQFVVIAAGGHAKFDGPRSDALVAFALP